ncbi:MAG: hypothetical protein D6696_05045 [Acidobacteria bacterium]|nr:MAG: hypothetical protein D6696_05045 [Acidobacteriota bacterium]
MNARPTAFFRRPVRDLLAGLDGVLGGGWGALGRVFAGLAAGWWLYVPLHELLHAAGCVAAGGAVTRLELAPLYGGRLLAAVLPFVVAGGDYAGRLAGFDAGGSDPIYAITVLAPYALTILPGVWLLRRWGARGYALRWGFVLPVALAPFLSLTGDAYELGALAVTQLPPWSAPATAELLRGDDLLERFGRWQETPAAPWLGGLLATLLGVLWAFATYAAGGAVAGRLEGAAAPASGAPDAQSRGVSPLR